MFHIFQNPTREYEGLPAQPGQDNFPDIHFRLRQVAEANTVFARTGVDIGQQSEEYGKVPQRGHQ